MDAFAILCVSEPVTMSDKQKDSLSFFRDLFFFIVIFVADETSNHFQVIFCFSFDFDLYLYYVFYVHTIFYTYIKFCRA